MRCLARPQLQLQLGCAQLGIALGERLTQRGQVGGLLCQRFAALLQRRSSAYGVGLRLIPQTAQLVLQARTLREQALRVGGW